MGSKRTSFATLLDPTATPREVPAGPPTAAPLSAVAPNPDNPRDPDDLDLDELIASFREVGQLQPVVVVTRRVYLEHAPRHAAAIGDADYVVLGGNRRLEAARALGWPRLDIVVRDELGNRDDGFLDEAVMIENIHRKNLAPMREAEFLQRLVERHGSQHKVAKRIGKTQAYVSQRLALLRLDPELQAAVDSGELKVKQARQLAGIEDHGGQLAAWKAAREAPSDNRVIAEAPSSGPVVVPEQPGPVEPAVPAGPAPSALGDMAAPPVPEESQRLEPRALERAGVGVPQQAAPTGRHRRDEGEPEGVPVRRVEAMPWGRPEEVLEIVRECMRAEDFATLIREGQRLL